MKASKFTDAQKAFIIKQGEEGTPFAEVCRQVGISQATYFNWKKNYAGMLPTDMKKLRELEDENRRLKQIVADLSLDKEMLQDVIKRKLVAIVARTNGATTTTLLARERWLTRSGLIGGYRSGGPVGLSGSIRGHIGTSFVDATRPRWNSGSRRFVGHVCGLVIGAYTCCCGGRVGRSMRRKPIAFTRNWACNLGTRHRNVA